MIVAAMLVIAVPEAAGAAPAEAEPPDPGGTAVTLITGDRVTVGDGGRYAVARGEGRDGITFAVRRDRGHLHVIPSDAAPLLRDDRLDPRLFDVTTLIESGYDDRRADLPLIVTAPSGPAARSAPLGGAARTAPLAGRLPAGFTAVRASRTAAAWSSARRATTGKIWLDGVRRPALDVSAPQIGAPAAWTAGLTGTGVPVAVLDTGIDDTHPDLAGRVTKRSNFTEGTEDDRDLVGHGTHVASILAGTGAASGGRFRGVAPGATLLDGKVCVTGHCAESWILAGMRWAAEQGADVINMSLLAGDTPGLDPLETAVEELTAAHGTLFVAAAGNDGGDRTVASPASADSALAVGAIDRHEALAPFSDRGPRPDGLAVKPEITAPGVDIAAARGRDASRPGAEPAPGYLTLSGTSMATPHVAGAAAILAQQHPDWTPAQLKATLIASARPNSAIGVFAQGAGRVDVARALTQTVTTTPATMSFGAHTWPHDDDVPGTSTLTYRNAGARAITLTLGTSTEVPAGLVGFSAPAITVPAGGEARVAVTVDTSAAGLPDGLLGGTITASAGDLVVRTPFGVEREPESYDVTIDVRGLDGAPARVWSLSLYDPETGDWRYDASWFGGTTARLPKGRYTMVAFVFTDTAQILAAQPLLTVHAPATLTVDGRAARPVSLTVPDRDATPVFGQVGVGLGARMQGNLLTSDLSTAYTLQIGPDSPAPGYASYVHAAFARPAGEYDWTDSPY